MARATLASLQTVVLPTLEVEVPEWEATVLLRALTRAQIRDCREAATVDGKVDLDTYDLTLLAAAVAEPDLIGEAGMTEVVRLLRAQPVQVVYRLVREAVRLSGLAPGAPFRSRTADDDRQRTVPGASAVPGVGVGDGGGDAPADEPC